MEYHSVDLSLDKTTAGSFVRIISPAEGEASSEFIFPFSELELENFILRMGQSRRGVRRVESPQMQAAKTFGTQLFEALFSGQVHDFYQNTLRVADVGVAAVGRNQRRLQRVDDGVLGESARLTDFVKREHELVLHRT